MFQCMTQLTAYSYCLTELVLHHAGGTYKRYTLYFTIENHISNATEMIRIFLHFNFNSPNVASYIIN
jgi:hypothetical protein